MSSAEDSIPLAFKPIRLQRFLAQCGLGSRRDCEAFITAGRVEVDGKTATELGTTVDPSRQTVSLDGERLKVERKKYFMLNKPSGYLCTSEDPQGRRVVLDLFPTEGPRLFTVGRLDENTTGLILVTNDGDLAQRLAHPRYRMFRQYRAQVAGQPKREVFEQLKQGLFFTEGKFRVYGVKPIKKQKDSTWVEITMTEGQNREIRRLFARVGHKVMKLERIGYGPLRLGRLSIGEYRDLTREELAELHAVLERNRKGDAMIPLEATRASTSRSRPRPAKSGATTRSASERPDRTKRSVENQSAPKQSTPKQSAKGKTPAGKWPQKATRKPSNRKTEEPGTRPAARPGRQSRPQPGEPSSRNETSATRRSPPKKRAGGPRSKPKPSSRKGKTRRDD